MSEPARSEGARRAAAFLLSLEREAAMAILKSLEPEVVTEIAEAMTQLEPAEATPDNVQALYLEIARDANTPAPIRATPLNELEALLRSSLGAERAQQVLRQIEDRRLRERPFRAIEAMGPDLVARVLSRESAAVAALVLAHLDTKLSGATLSRLKPELALEIVRRMAAVVPPSFDTLRAMALQLESLAKAVLAEPAGPDPDRRMRSIAEMLTRATGGTDKAVMEGLKSADEGVAKQVQEFMFTWDDLATIDKRAMQKILGAINTSSLAMALKGSPPAVEANVLGNLSSRAKAMVQEERELAGAVPLAQALVARKEILQVVRDLIESGELKPASAGEELVS